LVAVAAVAIAQALAQGSSITAVYARHSVPPLVSSAPSNEARRPSTPPRTWTIYEPGSRDSVLPVGRSSIQVPILMYHYIRIPPSPASDRMGYNLSVSPDDFRAQMDWLQDNGYHPVTIEEVRSYLEGRQSLPGRPVVLTFDDGYLDLYTTAYPILKSHNFRAVAYIVSGFIGAPDRNVTAEQIVEMDRYGIQIASHTNSHADLSKTAGANLVREVATSKQVLEAITGHPVLDFCYPSGKFNPAAVKAVQDAGYQSATTTQEGTLHTMGDRFTWSRVRVAGGMGLDMFARGVAHYEDGVPPPAPKPIQLPTIYPLELPRALPLRPF
jgi:peptidoglycan/xylan/chitin deacetylase (PgdA/CDA1 family)